MKLKLLGVRGSRPTHKDAILGYGGNSTSIELELDSDFYLFIDGGSGLVQRGWELTEKPEKSKFHVLISHTHWDHILGFPFFEPLYHPQNKFTFYASNTSRATFTDLFFGLQKSENLPVPQNQLAAHIEFKTILPATPFVIENLVKVSTIQLNHQGVTLGYRIEYRGETMAFISDSAPIDHGNYLGENMPPCSIVNAEFEEQYNRSISKFLAGVHTVVFDTHFSEKNLKPDWGHSTPEKALQFCEMAGTKRLILFHHAPEDTDAVVRQKVEAILLKGLKKGIEIEAAREGDTWLLRSA